MKKLIVALTIHTCLALYSLAYGAWEGPSGVVVGSWAEDPRKEPLELGIHAEVVKRTFIAPNGETAIVASSQRGDVKVLVRTHEMQIGEPSEERPDVIRSNCTYSRYPCSIVDGIDIFVNTKPIFVPRSVFCDLADLNWAEIRIGQKESTLTLTGGDASESYIVKIEFDAKQVKRRRTWSALIPDKPSEETIYHRLILKEK
jgi:hypothetical protein